MTSAARPYSDPYLCGVVLGLVLLAALTFAGRGLGASGAYNAVAAAGTSIVSARAAENSAFLRSYLDAPFWRDWLVLELAGVVAGALLSAAMARRIRFAIERGEGAGVRSRVLGALAGGAAMGAGAALARGCTSGLALTGGALLSVAGWVFMIAAFAGGYALAPLVRRAWR